jgi:hypothetical protein
VTSDRYKSLCQRIDAMENWKAVTLCAVCASKVTPIIAGVGLPGTWRLVQQCIEHVWQNIGQSSNCNEGKPLAKALESTPEWQIEDNSYLLFAVTQVLDFVFLALLAVDDPVSAKESAEGALDLIVVLASSYDSSAMTFPDRGTTKGAEFMIQARGGVAPFGQNKGKRGSLRGLPALRPIWGAGKKRRFSRERRCNPRDHAVPSFV